MREKNKPYPEQFILQMVELGYLGTMRVLKDGTRIGLRTESKTGGATLDIFTPSGNKLKVHIKP